MLHARVTANAYARVITVTTIIIICYNNTITTITVGVTAESAVTPTVL